MDGQSKNLSSPALRTKEVMHANTDIMKNPVIQMAQQAVVPVTRTTKTLTFMPMSLPKNRTRTTKTKTFISMSLPNKRTTTMKTPTLISMTLEMRKFNNKRNTVDLKGWQSFSLSNLSLQCWFCLGPPTTPKRKIVIEKRKMRIKPYLLILL